MNAWQTIILAIVGNTVAISALAFLFKSLINQNLARDLERYKSDLHRNADTFLSEVKHRFELLATEHRVRFSKLHEDRAQAIARLHSLLVVAYRNSASFASIAEWSGEPDKKAKYASAAQALQECYQYFDENRIFLPSETCESVDRVVKAAWDKVSNFGFYVQNPAMSEKALPKEHHEAWSSAWKFFRDEFPALRNQLESEFRALLSGAES